jgi:ubiquinone/menaquinone biosynthesis C-methylase UbiE
MFEKFRTRSNQLERLDTGDYTPDEYARWQREMWWIHRLFGELRALKHTLLNEIQRRGERSVSVLDVGAGSGELLAELSKWTKGKSAFFVGLEMAPEAAGAIMCKGITAVRADGEKLPFADGSFDYVFCTLVLHHLDDEAAVNVLAEMSRVANKRIFAIDLNRDPVPYYLYKYLGRLFLQPFTIEDGALSILRSRTESELMKLAGKAGLRDAKVEHFKANRLVLSAG